jgi:hypothetical protein
MALALAGVLLRADVGEGSTWQVCTLEVRPSKGLVLIHAPALVLHAFEVAGGTARRWRRATLALDIRRVKAMTYGPRTTVLAIPGPPWLDASGSRLLIRAPCARTATALRVALVDAMYSYGGSARSRARALAGVAGAREGGASTSERAPLLPRGACVAVAPPPPTSGVAYDHALAWLLS